jgi:Tfp pilus assembly major pilin PilA
MYKQNQGRKGFSLVEMSIIVIIIGLILAAVMKGQVIIDVAKVRAVVSEVNGYKASVNSFYAKYSALPGDFSEASAYWTSAITINGNGDGKIAFQNDVGAYEGYQAWQHLSNEKMVNIPLLGTQTVNAAVLDTDVPKSRMGGGYFFDYGSVANLTQDNILILGVPLAVTGSIYPARLNLDSGLTPQQAYDIDVKIDDGLPLQGAVQAAEGNTALPGGCIVTSGNIYHISVVEKKCILAFKIIKQ